VRLAMVRHHNGQLSVRSGALVGRLVRPAAPWSVVPDGAASLTKGESIGSHSSARGWRLPKARKSDIT